MTESDLVASAYEDELKRASCAYFAQTTLRGPGLTKDKPFVVADHHLLWDELVNSGERICALAARDHGKSAFFSFAYPLWKAKYSPGSRGYIFCNALDQAVKLLDFIKDEIEENPALADLIPVNGKRAILWNKTNIRLANGSSIIVRGFGSRTRGAHPNWCVVDDGLNDEDATSESIRRRHIDYFFSAITNMVVPGGQLAVVGTPFSTLDLYAELSKNSEYIFRKFAAVGPDGKALWPARYDGPRLAAKRREVGSVRFAREFQCEPVSDDSSIFPERLFRGDPVEQYTVKLGSPLKVWRELGVHSVYVGVDLAISTNVKADYFVVFVMGVDGQGNRWVMDIFRKRGMPYQQQLSVIQAMGKRYQADLIFVEANQMQRIAGDDLIRLTDLPIKKFNTSGRGKSKQHPGGNSVTSNKNTLEGGVPMLRVLLENRKFRIPRGDARSITVTEEWISELRTFTFADGKVKSVGHDDAAMACWIADQAVRMGGFSASTGDEPLPSQDELMRELMGDEEGEVSEAERMDEETQARQFVDRVLGGGADADDVDDGLGASQSSGNLVDLPEGDAAPAPVAHSGAWALLQSLVGR